MIINRAAKTNLPCPQRLPARFGRQNGLPAMRGTETMARERIAAVRQQEASGVIEAPAPSGFVRVGASVAALGRLAGALILRSGGHASPSVPRYCGAARYGRGPFCQEPNDSR